MLSTAESNDVAVAAERVLDMRLPVLEVLGEFDPCFGGGPDRDATPTAAGLVRHESSHFGKAVPLVGAFVVPGGAHRRLRLPFRRCSPSSRIGCPGWNVPQPTTTSASPVGGVRRRICGPARSGETAGCRRGPIAGHPADPGPAAAPRGEGVPPAGDARWVTRLGSLGSDSESPRNPLAVEVSDLMWRALAGRDHRCMMPAEFFASG